MLASGQFPHEDPPGKPTPRQIYWLRDTGTLAGGVRQAFTQSTPVRFAAMRSMLYCRVPSRTLGVGTGSIAVLPQPLAGDTGAFLVPAEARAAPPTWPAELCGQYTGIKAIGAGLRIDVQRSHTRLGVCSHRPGMS